MEENQLVISQNNPVTEYKPNENVQKIETSLAKFAERNFEVVEDEYEFQRDLQNEIRARLSLSPEDGGLKNNELIALINANSVALNDRVSKTFAPSLALATARQQAEISARAVENKSAITINNSSGGSAQMQQLNNEISTDILQGAAALSALINALKVKTDEKSTKEETN